MADTQGTRATATAVNSDGTETCGDDILYKPGDIIQEFSPPFVKVLTESVKGFYCDFCFKESDSLRRCAGCSLTYYCDRKCQRKDGALAHKIECKSLCFKTYIPIAHHLEAPDLNRDFRHKVFRLYALLKLHPASALEQYKMYDGTSRAFNDLIWHEDKLLHDKSYNSVLSLMANLMENEPLSPPPPPGNLYYLFRLAGIWKTNSTAMLNEARTRVIGTGIYIQGSYFDHGCRPTAISMGKGIDMEVRAIHTIKRGQKPVVSYLAGHRRQTERAKVLKLRYDFDCNCDLCQEECKFGDAMDYELLKSLKETPPLVNWTTILKGGQEEVKQMRKCYVEYDERISNKLLVLVKEVASLCAPKMILRDLANETERHLRITFGSDCDDLLELNDLRRMYGIPRA